MRGQADTGSAGGASVNTASANEHGPTKQVLQHPQHGYTIQLLDAVANPFAAASADSPASGRGN
jgi:ABC-type oligopeptide transport system ATPase subunit